MCCKWAYKYNVCVCIYTQISMLICCLESENSKRETLHVKCARQFLPGNNIVSWKKLRRYQKHISVVHYTCRRLGMINSLVK